MTNKTVRLTQFAEITGRPREAVRNLHREHSGPWFEEDDFSGSQRRYSGRHALAMILAEILVMQGFSYAQAGEYVKFQSRSLDLFLDEVESGEPTTSRFIMGMQVVSLDDWAGVTSTPSLTFGSDGTEEELLAAIGSGLSSIGNETEDRKRKIRNIAGPQVAIASISEGYRILKIRAKEAGFEISGRDITKIETNKVWSADET